MNESESDPPDWPYRSLVILGFWRPTSRAGKRLMLHSAVALLLFLGGFAGTQVLDAASWTRLSAALIPLAVLVIIRANVVYLRSLDSLEKLIQLTAFSAAYGAALFIGFFLFESIRAGFDVAYRTLHPWMPVEPDFFDYAIRLPEGQPRTLLISIITLLPGTLSAELSFDGRHLVVHELTPGGRDSVAHLEAWIAWLFSLPDDCRDPAEDAP